MSKVCARPLCYEQATVRFWFDGENHHVILDRKIEEWGGSGLLCEAHADRLTVARGWQLDDRRVLAPRLFSVPKDGQDRDGKDRKEDKPGLVARAKRLVQPSAHPSTPLPLEGGPTYTLPSAYQAVAETSAEDRAITERATTKAREAAESYRRTAGEEGMQTAPGARTPLLARAFDAASSRVRASSSLDALIPKSSPLPMDDEDDEPKRTTRA
jgi:hypothetical protein